MDFNEEMQQAVKNGLQKAVTEKLTGYNSPLEAVLKSVIDSKQSEIKTLLLEAVASALTEPDFRTQIATAVRHKLAQTLIQRFGGELEKQVNTLKSDPATRARITIAIEEIVKQHSAAA